MSESCSTSHLLKPFKGVVFDWDGTICSSTAAILESFQLAAKDLGLPVLSNEQVSNLMGLGWDDIYKALGDHLSIEQQDAFRQAFAGYYRKRELTVTMHPGMHALLLELKKAGVELAVATGKSRRGLNLAMDLFGITELFTTTMTVDECESKPSTDMLETIAMEFGVETSDLVMVGDRFVDLRMASLAHAQGIGVNWDRMFIKELEQEPHVAIVDTPYQLGQILGLSDSALQAVMADMQRPPVDFFADN